MYWQNGGVPCCCLRISLKREHFHIVYNICGKWTLWKRPWTYNLRFLLVLILVATFERREYTRFLHHIMREVSLPSKIIIQPLFNCTMSFYALTSFTLNVGSMWIQGRGIIPRYTPKTLPCFYYCLQMNLPLLGPFADGVPHIFFDIYVLHAFRHPSSLKFSIFELDPF